MILGLSGYIDETGLTPAQKTAITRLHQILESYRRDRGLKTEVQARIADYACEAEREIITNNAAGVKAYLERMREAAVLNGRDPAPETTALTPPADPATNPRPPRVRKPAAKKADPKPRKPPSFRPSAASRTAPKTEPCPT